MQTTSLANSPNRLERLVLKVHSLPVPDSVRRRLITLSAGLTVPYLRTSAIEIDAITAARVEVVLRNRKKVQNHMKTVHASAMFLLAESATGLVLSANLPDGSRFATTHIEIDYKQKAVGDLRAVAVLDEAQRATLRSGASGKLVVPVTLTDQADNEPATFVIEWAFRPGKQSAKVA